MSKKPLTKGKPAKPRPRAAPEPPGLPARRFAAAIFEVRRLPGGERPRAGARHAVVGGPLAAHGGGAARGGGLAGAPEPAGGLAGGQQPASWAAVLGGRVHPTAIVRALVHRPVSGLPGY